MYTFQIKTQYFNMIRSILIIVLIWKNPVCCLPSCSMNSCKQWDLILYSRWQKLICIFFAVRVPM